MIRPDEKTVKAFAIAVRQFPEILEFIAAWRMHELEQLPNVAPNIVNTAQGRCQVLTELCKLVNRSRELSAQSRKR